MATTPHPTPPPQPPAKVENVRIQSEPVKTIADEQRERSEEIQRMGPERYKREVMDRRDPERAPEQVPGVAKKS